MKAGFRTFVYSSCHIYCTKCALRNQPKINNNRWNRLIDSLPLFV